MKILSNSVGGRFVRAAISCAAISLLAASAAQAQQRHAHPPAATPRWHGDIRQFQNHDWHVWRGGHWTHATHGGRMGWWWVVGGAWYFYPTPVYPYPNPYEPPPAWTMAPPGSTLPPPTAYWYYCEAANGYYPYVPTCPGGWKQVPASPSNAAPAQPK